MQVHHLGRALTIIAVFALLGFFLPLFTIAQAQTTRPSQQQPRAISLDYALSRGALFNLVQRVSPCPYTIRAPEARIDTIEISIDCRLKPTRARFDFVFFDHHTLNNGWVVHDSTIGYLPEGFRPPRVRAPVIGFTLKPGVNQRNPRMDFFVEVPQNSQLFVWVRLFVKPGLFVGGRQHSHPLFRCERQPPLIGLPNSLPQARNDNSFSCSNDSQCAAGFSCGHSICGAQMCYGPWTGPD